MKRAKDHGYEIQPTWQNVNLTPKKQIKKKEKPTHSFDFFVKKIIDTLFSQNYEDNQSFFLFFSSSFFKQR